MTLPLPLQRNALQQGIADLRNDLLGEDGPKISTMRNYNFAIFQYEPDREFEVRAEVQKLTTELTAGGWMVLSLDLQTLLFERIRASGDEWAKRVIEMERVLERIGSGRGLNHLRKKLDQLLETPDNKDLLAKDCSQHILDYLDRHPENSERTLVIIGGAGPLYPFFRSSALLRHLDGATRNVPVVLLYPGERRGKTGLSFMGKLDPDNDYRPRIYP